MVICSPPQSMWDITEGNRIHLIDILFMDIQKNCPSRSILLASAEVKMDKQSFFLDSFLLQSQIQSLAFGNRVSESVYSAI